MKSYLFTLLIGLLTTLGFYLSSGVAIFGMAGTVADFPNFGTVGTPNLNISGGTVASAVAMPAPTGFLTIVSGTAAITTIALPYPGFEGMIAFRPTGIFTGATGGAAGTAIGIAFTAVVGKILYMYFDKATGLWYPSYLS